MVTANVNGKVHVEEAVLPEMETARFQIKLIGTSPLISHRWSKKAKQQMLDKQQKKATKGKEAKSPKKDYEESLYRYGSDKGLDPRDTGTGTWDKKSYGFPALAFKQAAVAATSQLDRSVTKVAMRGAFHVLGQVAKIEGTPRSREDMVRLSTGVADIRYRGEFPEWSTTLDIEYNTRVVSPAQIANLFNIAGFAVGIGEWRPQKDGNFGMFRVATD